MELKYLVIILSVVSICFLYFLSTLSQPLHIKLNEIPENEGKIVVINGIVTKYHSTGYGGQLIEIINADTTSKETAIIFVEEETTVEYGDKITATGKVQKYKGEWEVVVNSAQYIIIQEKWKNINIPLWQLAEYPERYVGRNVNISGSIERKYEGFFYLTNSEEGYLLVVYYDSSKIFNLSEGEAVSVGGRFIYDVETFRFVLEATEEHHFIAPMESG